MKLLRDNRIFIWQYGKKVCKIPLAPLAFKELSGEKEVIAEAAKDAHFSFYLPEYSFFGACIFLPYFKKKGADDFSIKEYFKKAFIGASQWNNIPASSLDECRQSFDFIKKYLPDNEKKWELLLSKIFMPQSSCHGDFYQENIFTEENKLFFIDWGQYNLFSSRYFDLINFYIFLKKEEKQSWIDAWRKEIAQKHTELFGISLPENIFLAYGVWKAGRELKILKSRKGITKFKKKKFINFFNNFDFNEN